MGDGDRSQKVQTSSYKVGNGNRMCSMAAGDFQPPLSRGTRELITKILQHTKNILYFSPTGQKLRYNFDSFTPAGCCCVVCCHFFYLTVDLREDRSVARTEQSGTACSPDLRW